MTAAAPSPNATGTVPAGPPATRRLSAAVLLPLGAVFLFLTLLRFGVAELGWVAFAPFLVVLHQDGRLKRHLALLATLLVTMVLTVSKIVTAEIPWGVAPMFAIPIALSYFVALSTGAAAASGPAGASTASPR